MSSRVQHKKESDEGRGSVTGGVRVTVSSCVAASAVEIGGVSVGTGCFRPERPRQRRRSNAGLQRGNVPKSIGNGRRQRVAASPVCGVRSISLRQPACMEQYLGASVGGRISMHLTTAILPVVSVDSPALATPFRTYCLLRRRSTKP
jgi:hypothetical protein